MGLFDQNLQRLPSLVRQGATMLSMTHWLEYEAIRAQSTGRKRLHGCLHFESSRRHRCCG
eukprot:5098644-Amphidinium_carterae.1